MTLDVFFPRPSPCPGVCPEQLLEQAFLRDGVAECTQERKQRCVPSFSPHLVVGRGGTRGSRPLSSAV